MKKIISLAVIGALALSLFGCSSDSKYDDLERRVSALEERLAESSTIETQTAVTVTTAVTSDISESSSEELAGVVYDLSNMSASEIVDLIPFYIDNRPKQGDTYDDVYSRLKIQPIDFRHDEYSISILYREDSLINHDVEIRDEVISISYGNAVPAMNGSTIDVPTDYYRTGIVFSIKDYNKAEEVFNLLGEFFSNSSFISDVVIQRDNGTSWNISYMVEYGSYGISGNTSMEKYDNGYVFYVSIT